MGKAVPSDVPMSQPGEHRREGTGHVAVSDDDHAPGTTRRHHHDEEPQARIDIGDALPATPPDLGDLATGGRRLRHKIAHWQPIHRAVVLLTQQGRAVQRQAGGLGNFLGGASGANHVAAPQHVGMPPGQAMGRAAGLRPAQGGELGTQFVPQHASTNVPGGLPMAHQGEIDAAIKHAVSLAADDHGWGSRAVGLISAVTADRLIPDPANPWHPVAWFGTWAGWLEKKMWRDSVGQGAAYLVVALLPVATLGVAVEAATRRHPLAHATATAAAGWLVIGSQSLATEGEQMADELEGDDLSAARDRLPHLCGRIPDTMPEQELARGTIESLAENTADSGVASLWWGSVAGIPGMLIHRASNTLDAMVGHHNEHFEHFGKCAARLDDGLDWIPARLTGILGAICAPSVGGTVVTTARIVARDARNHPSPNGGWCESAWAGALGVQLGGRNVYPGGRVEHRGLLGDGHRPRAGQVRDGARLVRVVTAAATALAAGACLGIGQLIRAHSSARKAPTHSPSRKASR